MANELNPHHLVALMNFTDTQRKPHFPSSVSTKHNIGEDSITDETKADRTFSLLDCLAKVAVSQKRSEAVAIALQCTHRDALSKEYGRSSVGSASRVGAIKLQMFREICEFSIERVMKRKEKWWEDLRGFIMQMCDYRGDDDLQEGVEMNLFRVATGLGMAFRLLGKPISHCENLAKKFPDHLRGDPRRLRKAIEKLIFPACHVECLVAYAKSPHWRLRLQYKFSASVVPDKSHTILLPVSQDHWMSILEAISPGHKDSHSKGASLLVKAFHPTQLLCPIHCECKIIQHLEAKHDNKWDLVPPFSYIAGSKPSCASCKIWIEAFNRLGGRQFCVGASCRWWDWAWVSSPVDSKIHFRYDSSRVFGECTVEEAMLAFGAELEAELQRSGYTRSEFFRHRLLFFKESMDMWSGE
ncbi:hypothetical protein HOY82DRAFT_669559 [Tuber indicum]|nr:hypothetical protein HOY82DRAFT_669559 [Tuber indicum]